jgi:short-chain fatty acids transporter
LFTFSLAFFWPKEKTDLVITLIEDENVCTVVSNKVIDWGNGIKNDTIQFNKKDWLLKAGIYKSQKSNYVTNINFQLSKQNELLTVVKSKTKFLELVSFWYNGLWGKGGLTFAFQMMLMLVLGHVLALSKPVEKLINKLSPYCNTTSKAALLVTLLTLTTSWFNWGLGLIFGAIFARKVGEYAMRNGLALNYGLIGAAGYSGLMIWHGGISGSSLIKVAEKGHFNDLISNPDLLTKLPSSISFNETVFSSMNITATISLLIILPLIMFFLGKKKKGAVLNLSLVPSTKKPKNDIKFKGAEKIDQSIYFSSFLGSAMIFYAIYMALSHSGFSEFKFINPDYLNFSLLGLALLMNGSISNFLSSLESAIKGVSGILIQFPLYFGIMGIMSNSGMINEIALFFINISNEFTYPLFTLVSAGLVNLFVPSGGGQWYVQGPIVIQTAIEMKISLSKSIMALAYGDQLTNMLQPFWALPLLGITGLKAKEILPYTLIIMLVGFLIFSFALILF